MTYVLTSAKLNAVGMRWVNDLADFQFTIKYKPGRENIDADYLSRRPTEIKELRKECTEVVEPHGDLGDERKWSGSFWGCVS